MEISIWDVLFWLALAIQIMWIIVKRQDLILIGISLILILIFFWKKLNKIDYIEKEISRIKKKCQKKF